MILNGILGTLAALSLVLTLWAWLAARKFPLHRRWSAGLRPGAVAELENRNTPDRRPAFQPAVTLLKPLKGADEFTDRCLRSWFAQDYAGEIQILFGVASAEDAACAAVKKLIAEFPQRDAQLVVCAERLGANAKVSKLAQLEPLVKHEVVVVSDADVLVPADFLANVVEPLNPERSAAVPAAAHRQGEALRENKAVETNESAAAGTAALPTGLVNCFYRLANPVNAAMRWEAVAVNADFWSQVLQSKTLKPPDFALGAVMATRRKHLAEIGGFRALADFLADDYQLGNRIARAGHRIEFCPVVVECWTPPMGWGAVWRHQLRWARTIRACQPAPYFFSVLANATLWPLVWLAIAPGAVSGAAFCVCLAARCATAADLLSRLTRGDGKCFWLAPVKDLLQVAIWAAAFCGNRIEWRGESYRLTRGGLLEKE